MVEISEQPEVTLQDFVISAKIEAFCEKFKPLDHWHVHRLSASLVL